MTKKRGRDDKKKRDDKEKRVSMQKKFLIIITFIFLTTLLGVFALANAVKAAPVGQCSECPPNDKQIRLQIYVPGITNTCSYTSKGAKEPTNCYFIESNLPAYIKKLYSFSIGAIAIIAVIMIMIGGLRWIFAAGNAGQIGEARQQITAAVAGLILALCSYVLLNAINPSLVKLTNINPANVETIEQGTRWCADFPQYYNNDTSKPYVFCDTIRNKTWPEDTFGIVSNCWFANSPSIVCGKTYMWGYRDKKTNKNIELGKGQVCYGNNCSSGESCYNESGYSYCTDPKKMCQNTPNNLCDEMNNKLYYSSTKKEFLSYSCFKRIDKWNAFFTSQSFSGGFKGMKDNCVWNKIIMCPGGSERVNCLEGPEKEIKNNIITGCWEYKGKKKVPSYTSKDGSDIVCEDSIYANKETSVICCKDGNDYKLQEGVTVDCKNASTCNIYNSSREACERNICKVPYSCEWKSNKCEAK